MSGLSNTLINRRSAATRESVCGRVSPAANVQLGIKKCLLSTQSGHVYASGECPLYPTLNCQDYGSFERPLMTQSGPLGNRHSE